MKTFNEKVYEIVKKIPKGKVMTYKQIAYKLNSKAYRAIGTALKNNPHPIKVPCHRVINSDRTVGGYKGKKNSKLKIKLLKKEGVKIINNKIDKKNIIKL